MNDMIRIIQGPISLQDLREKISHKNAGNIDVEEAVLEEMALELFREPMQELLGALTPREKRVIELRFGIEDGHARTLKQVGLELSLTPERIRQIEATALRKLRRHSKQKK